MPDALTVQVENAINSSQRIMANSLGDKIEDWKCTRRECERLRDFINDPIMDVIPDNQKTLANLDAPPNADLHKIYSCTTCSYSNDLAWDSCTMCDTKHSKIWREQNIGYSSLPPIEIEKMQRPQIPAERVEVWERESRHVAIGGRARGRGWGARQQKTEMYSIHDAFSSSDYLNASTKNDISLNLATNFGMPKRNRYVEKSPHPLNPKDLFESQVVFRTPAHKMETSLVLNLIWERPLFIFFEYPPHPTDTK